MRLLNTATLTLEEFVPNKIPPYAILSHTWGENEVVFEDFQRLTAESKTAWKTKVEKCCQQAVQEDLNYVWIDTCCIDKSSSAELSESINSMYSWYEKAQVCYAHLEDVSSDVDPSKLGSPFDRSRWFTRDFTLQELIAPREVVFLSNDWVEIGRKSTVYKSLYGITEIDEDILLHQRPVTSASVARRMAWAAYRQTTRPEDIAYCLMGLFSVNMPMLYGEGEKAFLRLQEEIMKQSDDQSIFAWTDPDASPDSLHGLLAPSPAMFAGCANILPYQDWEPRQPYTMTNRGLQIELSSYCQGLIETGLSRLPKEVTENHKLLPYQGSIQDHIRLIEISQEVMRKLIEDKRIQDAATPVLLHPDFNKGNIYVSPDDPTVITGIIDWQSTSIEPAVIYANDTPDFASLPGEPEKELEDAQGEPKTPSDKERERKDALICHQTYDVCMKGLAPKLRTARLLDQTLFRLFHYCHTTWGDSAPAVRQELIELSTCWK